MKELRVNGPDGSLLILRSKNIEGAQKIMAAKLRRIDQFAADMRAISPSPQPRNQLSGWITSTQQISKGSILESPKLVPYTIL
jgi:hypothetical protein